MCQGYSYIGKEFLYKKAGIILGDECDPDDNLCEELEFDESDEEEEKIFTMKGRGNVH